MGISRKTVNGNDIDFHDQEKSIDRKLNRAGRKVASRLPRGAEWLDHIGGGRIETDLWVESENDQINIPLEDFEVVKVSSFKSGNMCIVVRTDSILSGGD